MSSIAYIDVERKKKITASAAQMRDKKARYYCPNLDCNADLFLIEQHGMKNAYFSANKKAFPHINGCDYRAGGKISIGAFDEKSFDFKMFTENLLGAKNSRKNNIKTIASPIKSPDSNKPSLSPVKTLKELICVCSQLSKDDNYNGFKIRDMILNAQNSKYYKDNEITGSFAVKAHFGIPRKQESKYYNNTSQEINFTIETQLSINMYAIVHIQNGDLYKKLCKKIYFNKDIDYYIFCDWKIKEDDVCGKVYYGELLKAKQIARL